MASGGGNSPRLWALVARRMWQQASRRLRAGPSYRWRYAGRTPERVLIAPPDLRLADPQIATPIGVSCRTCPRTDCAERAMPSLFQKLHIDENVRGPSTYVNA